MSLEHSLYAGAYSLKNFQTKLDVHGNNISNISTIGFKRSIAQTRESFQSELYSAIDTQGGTSQINPTENGYGQSQLIVNVDARNGTLQETGRPLDLAIQGDGYFMVDVNGDQLYTRDGNFNLDREKNLVMSNNGAFVMGWLGTLNADGTTSIDLNGEPQRLRFDTVDKLAPRTSSYVDYSSNLNTEATGKTMTLNRDQLTIQDGNRNPIDLRAGWTRTGDSSWRFSSRFGNEDLFTMDATIDPLGNIASLDTQVLKEDLKLTTDSETGFPKRMEMTYTSPLEDEPDATLPLTLEFDDAAKLNEDGSRWAMRAKLASPEDPLYSKATAIDFTSQYGIGESHNTFIPVVDSAGEQHDLVTVFEKISTTDTEFSYRVSLPKEDSLIQQWLSDPTNNADPNNPSKTDIEMANEAIFGNSRYGRLAFTEDGILDPEASTIPNLRGQLNNTGLNLDLNMDLVTGFGAPFSTAARDQDGYVAGDLIRSTVSSTGDGQIVANFTNGEERILGQVGVGIFQNAAGLIKTGNNMFRAGNNAGVDLLSLNIPSEGRRGLIRPGFLELSNVNLLEEFTQLIVTQRSLQANSKAINVSDELLQTGINTKR